MATSPDPEAIAQQQQQFPSHAAAQAVQQHPMAMTGLAAMSNALTGHRHAGRQVKRRKGRGKRRRK